MLFYSWVSIFHKIKTDVVIVTKARGPGSETFLQKILGPNMFCALFIQIDYSLPTRENACWWVELINLAGPVIQGKTTETKPTQIRADPPLQNRYRFLVLFIYGDVIWPMYVKWVISRWTKKWYFFLQKISPSLLHSFVLVVMLIYAEQTTIFQL